MRNRDKFSLPRRLYITICVVAVCVAGVIAYSLYMGNRMAAIYAPLSATAMKLKFDAAIAHLWFEEIMAGDPHDSIDVVWQHLDEATHHARLMLDGGQTEAGSFTPLEQPLLQAEIAEVQLKIDEFRAIAELRYNSPGPVRAGTVVDQEFDAVFKALLLQADHVESELQRLMAEDLRQFWIVQIILILVGLGFAGVVIVLLYRYNYQRVVAFNALRISEDRLQAILDNTPTMLCLKDIDGRYILVNKRFESVFQLQADNIKGKSDRELFDESTAEQLRENDRLVLESLDPMEVEEVVRLQDGLHTYAAVKFPLLAQDGSVWAIGTISTDITERKREEDARQSLELQLHQSQKMEAVGQLAGGVAHDFNNILTIILGNTELLKMAVEASPPINGNTLQTLDTIQESANRAAALVRQLLVYSRQDVAKPEVIDLNGVLDNIELMLRRLLPEDIALDVVAGPQTHRTYADRGQIEQIIMNMVVNARDAMLDGGSLTIETGNLDLDQSYVANNPEAHPGPHVMLAVSDSGLGIDAKTMNHIYEPFFTTKPIGEGTGLGLATVYGIVRRWKGHVVVYSEPGQGTTFKVFLPAVEAASERPAEAGAKTLRRKGTATVLLCEDDHKVRDLSATMLKSAGYKVLEAANAAQAIELSSRHGSLIELLVTDVILPDMNGRELSETVTASLPGMKTIFVSGYTSNVIARHGILAQDVAFIEKPYTSDTLLERVSGVLAGT